MEITGSMLIGAVSSKGKGGGFKAFSPVLNAEINPVFGCGEVGDVDRACKLAARAFPIYRGTTPHQRAHFLETIARHIEEIGDSLIERAALETALPKARLEGERGRTTSQLRHFAQVVRMGHWLSATLDSPLPERTPFPRPDLRKCHVAVGPVAVFGASNFPLAFSVAGGDTAAALAAGCPVVVKAHGAHPGTSELVGRAVQAAVAECGLPEGTFSLIQGVGNMVGEALVDHPAIRAVGFTGSRAGGLALSRRAAAREVPIPVYAEMSSVNPVVLLPQALAARAESIGQAFVDSLTLGVGQFCTNPGIVIAIDGPELDQFVDATAQSLRNKASGTMLTPGIAAAYAAGVKLLAEHECVETIASGQATSGDCDGRAHFFATDAASFLAHPELRDEIFGPSSILVRCRDIDEIGGVLECLEGQLTATLQMDSGDVPLARQLLPLLEDKVGRILVNGFPTGVEVSHAMVHGGPFPATTDSRTTSVGSAAIDRFLRPVCYQNFPADLLPAALSDVNVLAIPRVIDGNVVLPN